MKKVAIIREFPELAGTVQNGPHAGQKYIVAELAKESAPLSHTFHQAVIDDIAKITGHECKILLPKSESYFKRHAGTQFGSTVGIVSEGNLIGLALAHYYGCANDNNAEGICLLDPKKSAFLQSASVSREYRRNGLQLKLIAGRVLSAQHAGRTELISQIELGNIPSLSNILKSGFKINGLAHYKNPDLWAYNTFATTETAIKRIKDNFNTAAQDTAYDGKISIAEIIETKSWPANQTGIALSQDKKNILLRKTAL